MFFAELCCKGCATTPDFFHSANCYNKTRNQLPCHDVDWWLRNLALNLNSLKNAVLRNDDGRAFSLWFAVPQNLHITRPQCAGHVATHSPASELFNGECLALLVPQASPGCGEQGKRLALVCLFVGSCTDSSKTQSPQLSTNASYVSEARFLRDWKLHQQCFT